MAERPIRFDDGAGYERMMGVWSRSAGNVFLDWLSPSHGLSWIDIGCGNGAFTELLVERCAPSEIHGVDPSPAQLEFARTRPAARVAQFHEGDAMALPFPDAHFDAATMALSLFFFPDPAKGVAEAVRVTKPGSMIAAYVWDMLGGGFPLHPVHEEMRALGISPPLPPSAQASRMEILHGLWRNAGLQGAETRTIAVTREFTGFDEFWSTAMLSGSMKALAASAPEDIERVKQRVRERLPADATGRITCAATANAIRGRLP
jgi:SAM-dependent methyltransferase